MRHQVMKTIIVEIDDFDLIRARLDGEMTDCIRRVARSIRKLLKQDPVRQDAASCDPNFLALCERGATRLTIFGERKKATLMVDPTFLIDAHTAASLLASSRRLAQDEREDLLQVFGFLAAILPVWLATGNLPPWEQVQNADNNLKRVPQIYEALRARPISAIGFRPIKMCDALILREGLKFKVHPELQSLREDLTQVTMTHRNALAALMRNTS